MTVTCEAISGELLDAILVADGDITFSATGNLIGLATNNGTALDGSDIAEASYGAYARVTITNGMFNRNGSRVTPAQDITWPANNSGGDLTFQSVVIYRADGTPLRVAGLRNALTVANGEQPRLPAGTNNWFELL